MVVFSNVAAAIVGLSALASAMPMAPPRQGFTIDQLTKLVPKRLINLPDMYARALSKYGATVPANVRDAASSGSAVTIPEEYDIEYLTPVNVGGRVMNLDIDTGSADLWVFSTQLPATQQAGHDVYSPSGNATKLAGHSWDISYGDGSSARGDVYLDRVTVGGITAQRQAVEAAQYISNQFVQDRNNDGLLGLAFSSINTIQPNRQTTFFDTVKSQLDSPLFAVALKYHAPGSYDFGYIDEKKFHGSITYTDVDSTYGFWKFSATAGSTPFPAIADTGTTLIMIDSSIAEAYYAEVPSAEESSTYGGWVFPCSTDLPPFNITIEDYEAVIPGKHINYAPVTEGSTTCFGGIQNNQGLQFGILGDVFLKSQYVVFDSSGPRLGFAPQA